MKTLLFLLFASVIAVSLGNYLLGTALVIGEICWAFFLLVDQYTKPIRLSGHARKVQGRDLLCEFQVPGKREPYQVYFKEADIRRAYGENVSKLITISVKRGVLSGDFYFPRLLPF